MDIEKFKELREFVSKESNITPDNVEQMVLKLPNLTFRFVNIYANEKRLLLKMERELEMIYAKTYERIKFDGDYKISSVTEADVLVKGDDQYHSAKIKFDQQKVIVDFISDSVDLFKKLNFNINYYLEFMKLKHGVIS